MRYLLLAVAVFAFPLTAYADAWTIVPTWLELIEQTPECATIPTEVVLGVIHIESNGVASTIRDEGDRGQSVGLMQVMDRWSTGRGWLLVPANNVAMGCGILARVLEQENGDLRRTLARYNCGLVNLEANGCGLDYADEILLELAPRYAVLVAELRYMRRLDAYISAKRYPIVRLFSG